MRITRKRPGVYVVRCGQKKRVDIVWAPGPFEAGQIVLRRIRKPT